MGHPNPFIHTCAPHPPKGDTTWTVYGKIGTDGATQVKKHKNVQFFLEASQLAWDRGQQTEAISALKKGLKEAFPTMQSAWEAGDEEAIKVVSSRLDKEEKGPCQRGKLLLAKYLNDSASVTPSVIAKHYLQVFFNE